jgi:hypothetical protein
MKSWATAAPTRTRSAYCRPTSASGGAAAAVPQDAQNFAPVRAAETASATSAHHTRQGGRGAAPGGKSASPQLWQNFLAAARRERGGPQDRRTLRQCGAPSNPHTLRQRYTIAAGGKGGCMAAAG